MKYRITDETVTYGDHKLRRIEALKDFGDVKKGDKGGWVESEFNLSQNGDAWVYGDAKVFGAAEVCGHAVVYGDAVVSGDAVVFGDAKVCGHAKVNERAKVYGDARVYGDAVVSGDAKVYGNAELYGNARVAEKEDYSVLKNTWSSGRFFTYTSSNKKWRVGCFYGTGEELVAKAFNDSELSGKCYEATVKYVEEIERLKKELGNV